MTLSPRTGAAPGRPAQCRPGIDRRVAPTPGRVAPDASRRRGSLAFACLALVLAAGAMGCGSEARREAREAGQLLESGETDAALAAYRSGRERHPEAAIFPLGEGMALYVMGLHEDAEVALRDAIGLDADKPEAHLYLGHTLANQGRHEAAADSYRRATRLNPRDARAWKALGLTAYNLRDYAEARAALEKYLAFAREAEDVIAISALVRSLPAAGDGDAGDGK